MSAESIEISVKREAFRKVNISTATGHVRDTNSIGVSVPLDTVAISVILENATETGTFDLEFYAEGSFDRRTWSRSGLHSLNVTIGSSPVTPSYNTSDALQIVFPYLRMRATVTGGSALFSADFVFSDQ